MILSSNGEREDGRGRRGGTSGRWVKRGWDRRELRREWTETVLSE